MEVTVKKYYTCSKCGRTSTSQKKIEECEQGHIGIDEAHPIEMVFGKGRIIYPELVKVMMHDGKVANYNFVKAASPE